MKRKVLLFTLCAGIGSVILSSYGAGPASQGYDCTGAEAGGVGNYANPTGCSTGGGCHKNSATTTVGVVIELDSAGTPVTQYKPGMTYTVKILGTNGTGNTFAKYGFQIAAMKGVDTALTVADAGVLSGATSGTHIVAPGMYTYLTVAEHSSPITLSGTTTSNSFTWTAPAAGTGTISFWGAVNLCVSASDHESTSDLWNTTHVNITELITPASVASMANDAEFSVFPNPATGSFALTTSNTTTTVSVRIFDMTGRLIFGTVSNGTTGSKIIVDAANWNSGIYQIVVDNGVSSKVKAIVKE